MPLSVLVPLVVLGIAGIAVLLHLLGWSRQFDLGSEETVRREWLRHFPDDSLIRCLIAPDGHAALVLTSQGPGLLRSFGADTVAHRIVWMRPADTGLKIGLGEFAAPDLHLPLSEDIRRRWIAALAGERFNDG